MARRLSSYDFTKHRRGNRSGRAGLYPWDRWFDGSIWRLRLGEDFHVQPLSMQRAVFNAAKRHGVEVRVSATPRSVVLQAKRRGRGSRAS